MSTGVEKKMSKARLHESMVSTETSLSNNRFPLIAIDLPLFSSVLQVQLVNYVKFHVQKAIRKSKVALLSTFVIFALGLGRVPRSSAAGVATINNQRTSVDSNVVSRGSSERMGRKVEVELSTGSQSQSMLQAIVGHGHSSSHSHSHQHSPSNPAAAQVVVKKTAPSAKASAVPAKAEQSTIRKFFSFKREFENIGNEAGVHLTGEVDSLMASLRGAKQDTLIMLIATSAVIPIFKRMNVSPILGFLAMGTLIGHAGIGWVYDEHTIHMLGDLGIVFFLFEMGLELSIARLKSMKKDVFGLGTSQFALTAAVGTGIAAACGLPTAAAVTIGGSIALSSSAFVLQLLKDKDAMGSRHGRASFGILLLQDLAVVPLLVVVELLAKGGAGLGKALAVAGVKAFLAVMSMGYVGRKLLDPIFYFVAKSRSQEAFLSIILATVLLMSFVTQGIGLSNTLGAFLAGLLLAETKYKYQVEADIAPFRGLLLGFFFITVGFNIDAALIVAEAPRIASIFVAMIAGKAAIITTLCLAFGMSFANAQRSGLLLSQGGEFSFVALGIADRSGLIDSNLCKVLMTTVALSMAATPALAELGGYIADRAETEKDSSYYTGADGAGAEEKSTTINSDFVFVSGYGRVGKMVCDMLDKIGIKYVAVDSHPQVCIEARGKGLPVFYGDINRPEVLRSFNVGASRACVFATDDATATNKAVITVRQMYPNLPLVVRAKNMQHKQRLEEMFKDLSVMTPMLTEDSVLLTLPFGGAVLQNIGVSKPEIDSILEDFRKKYMEDRNFDDNAFDYLSNLSQRLPPSSAEEEEVWSDFIDKEGTAGEAVGSGLPNNATMNAVPMPAGGDDMSNVALVYRDNGNTV